MRKWTYPYLEFLAERAEDEWDLSKSWPSESTKRGTSDIWQSRQSRSAEAELHIFGSPGRDGMRKWTFPYLEEQAEQVRKMNENFRSPGRAEVWKMGLQIFGSKDSGIAEAKLYTFKSPGRAEVWKRNFVFLEVQAEMKCGSGLTHTWKSWQNIYGRWKRSFGSGTPHLTKSWPDAKWTIAPPLIKIQDKQRLFSVHFIREFIVTSIHN